MSATAKELETAANAAVAGGTADSDVVAVPIPQPQPEAAERSVGPGAAASGGAAANAKRFKIGNKPKPPRRIEEEENASAKETEPVKAALPAAPPSDTATDAPKKPFFLFPLLYGVADGFLELLNRPFARVPNGARGAIGGAAVVTLVMAVAGGVGGPLLWPRSSALDAIERRKEELRAAEAAAAAAALEAAHAKKEEKKGEKEHGGKVEEKKPAAGGH